MAQHACIELSCTAADGLPELTVQSLDRRPFIAAAAFVMA
jgi:hypothetical protein